MQGIDESKLMNTLKAAEYLSISANTLYLMVARKKIEYIKLNKLVRFSKQALDRHIAKHTVREIEN